MTDAPHKPDWDDLKELIRWFAIVFGQPSELVERRIAPRALGRTMLGWLAALEAYTRSLLVTMAAELPRPAAAPSRGKASSASHPSKDRLGGEKPARDVIAFDAPDSEDSESQRWTGVRFPLLPSGRSTSKEGRARKETRTAVLTRPFAYRFEALIRVAEAPGRYAARMARLLYTAPHLALRVLREPCTFGCRSAPRDALDALAVARKATGAFARKAAAVDTS